MPAVDPSDYYDAPMPPEAFAPDDAPDLSFIGERTVLTGEEIERAQRWEINSDGAAQWAMAHVAEVAAQEARLETQFGAWRENLDALIERRRAPLDRRRRFFEERLVDYARRLREADPKAKTLELPSGRVASRASGASITVEDEEAFLKWADLAERTDLFRIERKPELSPIRQALKAEDVGADDEHAEWIVLDPTTGEEVPGLSVRAPKVDYRVHPA